MFLEQSKKKYQPGCSNAICQMTQWGKVSRCVLHTVLLTLQIYGIYGKCFCWQVERNENYLAFKMAWWFMSIEPF